MKAMHIHYIQSQSTETAGIILDLCPCKIKWIHAKITNYWTL